MWDTDAGPGIPTVYVIHAASPFSLKYEGKGGSVKSKGWQFNVVINQVISIWFWCTEINAILNCCLCTEGLDEATLRVWLHGEDTAMRRLPKEEIVSRLQNTSSQFCFRWWYPVWCLWGEIIERKQSVRSAMCHFRVKVPKLLYWKLSLTLKISHTRKAACILLSDRVSF